MGGEGVDEKTENNTPSHLCEAGLVGAVFLRDAVYMCVSLDAELDCNEIIYSRSIVTEISTRIQRVRG